MNWSEDVFLAPNNDLVIGNGGQGDADQHDPFSFLLGEDDGSDYFKLDVNNQDALVGAGK